MKAKRWLVLTAIALLASRMLRVRGNRPATVEDRRSLWVFHQYAVSPDMPEINRHWELASLLKAHGWHTTLFATSFNHKARRFQRPNGLMRPIIRRSEQGVDFDWLYSIPYDTNNWRRYVNMLSYLVVSVVDALVRRHRPSIVIGTSPQMFAGLAGLLVARRYRVPFVLEVQDLWPESIVQLGVTNPVIVRPLEWLERFLYRHSDHIISLSEGITDGIVAKGVPSNKVTLISNAAMRPGPKDQQERARSANRCTGAMSRRSPFGWVRMGRRTDSIPLSRQLGCSLTARTLPSC